MLTPQFSLRRLLLLVTVCAVVSLILASGTRGYQWGLSLSIMLLAAIALALIQAFLYGVIKVLGVAFLRFQEDDQPD